MKSTPSQLLIEAQPWFESLKARGLSAATVLFYQRTMERSARIWARHGGPRRVAEITVVALESLVAELRRQELAPASRDALVRPWILFLQWMEERGAIFSNPARRTLLVNPPRRFLPVHSEREIVQVLESVAGSDPETLRDRAIFETAYATGMRLGELHRLDVADVNFEEKTVFVRGKGARERIVPLTESAKRAVKEYLDAGRPKFAGESSLPALWLVGGKSGSHRFAYGGISVMIKRRSLRAGIRISPHSLRRAFATHLLRRGLGLNELRMLLGHAGFLHIRHYARYAMVDLKRAHARSKLGQ